MRRFAITVAAYVAALLIVVIPLAIGWLGQFFRLHRPPGHHPS